MPSWTTTVRSRSGLKACRSSGAGSQHIHIKYDGLGFIPLNELLKHERRDRSHAVPEKIRYSFLMTPVRYGSGFFQAEVFAKSAIMASMPCMIS